MKVTDKCMQIAQQQADENRQLKQELADLKELHQTTQANLLIAEGGWNALKLKHESLKQLVGELVNRYESCPDGASINIELEIDKLKQAIKES